MKKRKINFNVVVFIIIGIIAAVFIANHYRTRREEERLSYMLQQSVYIRVFRFHNNIQRFWDTYMHLPFELEQAKLVFVTSMEEAETFPDGIAVFWPSLHSLMIMEAMNEIISEHELDLDEYTLSYPLTIDDLVYRWEKIWDFTGSRHPAPVEGPSIMENIDVRYEYFRRLDTELEIMHSFLENVDTSAYDIVFPIERVNFENAVALYGLYWAEMAGNIDIPTVYEEMIRIKLLID